MKILVGFFVRHHIHRRRKLFGSDTLLGKNLEMLAFVLYYELISFLIEIF